jgi:threonine/homoserine/homoserine lactone efflux protein
MSTAELTALLLLCAAASFTPGPNTTLSTALAANLGFKRALRFALSVPVGWGLLFSVCAGGVGAMVVAVPVLRIGIQAIGIIYLLWLAYNLLTVSTLAQADGAQLEIGFMQGVLLQFLNIKVWMLSLTVAGGWLAGRNDAMARFAVILSLLAAFGLCSNLTYALAGSLLRQWLADPEHAGRRLRYFNRCMASILVATAAWMATF